MSPGGSYGQRSGDKEGTKSAISVNRCRWVRLRAANVTVYILAPPDPPLHFVPPLGNNRTYVVYLKEPYPEVDPVGSVVFQPSVRDVDNASAVFRFQLNCTDNEYLAIDPNTG